MPRHKKRKQQWDVSELIDGGKHLCENSSDGTRISCRICHLDNGNFLQLAHPYSSTKWNKHLLGKEHQTKAAAHEKAEALHIQSKIANAKAKFQSKLDAATQMAWSATTTNTTSSTSSVVAAAAATAAAATAAAIANQKSNTNPRTTTSGTAGTSTFASTTNNANLKKRTLSTATTGMFGSCSTTSPSSTTQTKKRSKRPKPRISGLLCPGFTLTLPNEYLILFMKYGMKSNDSLMGKFRIVVPQEEDAESGSDDDYNNSNNDNSNDNNKYHDNDDDDDDDEDNNHNDAGSTTKTTNNHNKKTNTESSIRIYSTECSGYLQRLGYGVYSPCCVECHLFRKAKRTILRERVARMEHIYNVEQELRLGTFSSEGKFWIQVFLNHNESLMNDNKKELKRRCILYMNKLKALEQGDDDQQQQDDQQHEEDQEDDDEEEDTTYNDELPPEKRKEVVV